MEFDAQKLEELSKKYKTTPGQILDLTIALRNHGCPTEMLKQAVLDELWLRYVVKIVRTLILIIAIANFLIGTAFIFIQMTLIPEAYRYDEVLKTILGWGLLGLLLSASIAAIAIYHCRRLLRQFLL
ncbi:MAG: hypothetical protein SAJ12_05825 [Jaaginema sp. PMC 1079.18]|nr:hypothetical protein [Jaaginema sp. PMC 1080.18]MEC4850509.1 hypothetical protein [Jaaginema sp. PMC 1079.18]MEC4864766.1 hypothetical protein [Jaaginema sp. PMC 1078.18]